MHSEVEILAVTDCYDILRPHCIHGGEEILAVSDCYIVYLLLVYMMGKRF